MQTGCLIHSASKTTAPKRRFSNPLSSLPSLDGLRHRSQEINLVCAGLAPSWGPKFFFKVKRLQEQVATFVCRMFCQATGYGGTVQQGSTVEEKLQKRQQEVDASLEAAAAARNLTISFNADVSDGMNWKFVPTQRSVKINPGQSTLAFYTAHNLSDKAVTGKSFHVTPN